MFDGVFATACDRAHISGENPSFLGATVGTLATAIVLVPTPLGVALGQAIELLQMAVAVQ